MLRAFVPGWGAPPSLYARALPAGWTVLEPPSFAESDTILARLRWLQDELDRYDGPVTLAGHSMGAALAVLAAGQRPERMRKLLLVAPAGLPLAKPLAACLRDFARQVATRAYPLRDAGRAIADALAAPRSSLRLAQAVRALDLRPQLDVLRAFGVPV